MSKPAGSNVPGTSYPDDPNDPVVATVPVFLSQELMNNLYLCQYPLRPAGRPYDADMGPMTAVRVKPKARMVEMQFEIDQRNGNYDEHADEPIQAFHLSSTGVPPKTNYAVGVLREGQLHLTPLHAVVRMRPNFEYIDNRKQMERDRDAFLSMDDAEREAAREQAQEMKPVMVKFKKKETERSAAYRKLSHMHHKQTIDAEPWVPMTPFKKEDEESRQQFEKLIAQSAEPITFDIAAREYLAYINPPPSAAGAPAQPAMGSGDVTAASSSRITQQKMPVGDHALKLLATARVLSFGTILLETGAATEPAVMEVLATLQDFAYLVQGNWVTKSELPPGRQAIVRDYVMSQFWRQRVLKREALKDLLKVDLEALDAIFEEFAVRLPDRRGWEFKLPTDDKFMKMYAPVVREQNKKLEEIESRNRWQLQQSYAPPGEQTVSMSMFESKRLIGSNSASASSSSSSAAASNSGGLGLLPPSSGGASNSASASSSSSAMAAAAAAPVDAAQQKQRLTVFLYDLFNNYGVCSATFINRRLDKHRDKRGELGDVSDALLNATLAEIGMSLGNLWCRKSLNNEEADKYRSIIFSVFTSKKKVKKSDVVEAVQTQLKDEVPDAIYTQLMKEFAVYEKSQGLWVLKTGNYAITD